MPKKMPKGAGVFRNREYIQLLDNARKTLEKYITEAGPGNANSSTAKRAIRALMSQDDLQFLKVLQDNAGNLDPVSLAKKIATAENSIRARHSPSPGVEMHHVNSISSWYEKIKNMPTKEAMQANHYVQSKGHILGTDKRLLPLTKDIHQGGRNIPTAHTDIIKSVQADRWVVDQGAWKTDNPAASNADPFEVGDNFIDEAANIQGRLSFSAYEDPTEVKARQALRIRTGHKSNSKTINKPQVRSAQKAEQKAMGLNLGDIRKELISEVTDKPSVTLGQRAAAIVNREPLPQPKPQPAPQAKPAPKPAPTTKLSSVRISDTTPKPPRPKPGISRTVTKPQPKVSSGARRGAAPAASKFAGTRVDPRNPGSASMQIRRMQNTVPDAIQIHPGMSLPSHSLIQGV